MIKVSPRVIIFTQVALLKDLINTLMERISIHERV